MNDEDRKRMTSFEDEVRDVKIIQNTILEDVDDIKNNHLHAIRITLEYLKARQTLMLKVIGWGMAGLAIVIAIIEIGR